MYNHTLCEGKNGTWLVTLGTVDIEGTKKHKTRKQYENSM